MYAKDSQLHEGQGSERREERRGLREENEREPGSRARVGPEQTTLGALQGYTNTLRSEGSWGLNHAKSFLQSPDYP